MSRAADGLSLKIRHVGFVAVDQLGVLWDYDHVEHFKYGLLGDVF